MATRRVNLSDLPFWTIADEAEAGLLAFELVLAHERGVRGKQLENLIGLVLDWRDRRIMRSRAAWFREQQGNLEIERAVCAPLSAAAAA